MKQIVLLLVVASIGLAGDFHKEFQVQPGKKLDMDISSGGAISVKGWDKNTVTVDVTFRGDDDRDFSVEADETSRGVSVTSHERSRYGRSHRNSPRFDVRVPAKFDLDLSSAGGTFTIEGVDGDLQGTTMGGALQLTKLKGKVNFHTMGGSITLTSSQVDGEVETNGGKVKLEDVTGTVNGHTMGGSVEYRNVSAKAGDKNSDVVRISSMGGEINVDEAPGGADVSTMGGNVTIGSAAKFVRAKTMGGEINVDRVDGWVHAETMGGDVRVTMVGDPAEGKRDVEISSKGGDVVLTVPPGLSMDVDITIDNSHDGNWDRREGRIESDFALKEETKEKSSRHDRWGHELVRGTGIVGDGKNKVRISTINGDVILKKGS